MKSKILLIAGLKFMLLLLVFRSPLEFFRVAYIEDEVRGILPIVMQYDANYEVKIQEIKGNGQGKIFLKSNCPEKAVEELNVFFEREGYIEKRDQKVIEKENFQMVSYTKPIGKIYGSKIGTYVLRDNENIQVRFGISSDMKEGFFSMGCVLILVWSLRQDYKKYRIYRRRK